MRTRLPKAFARGQRRNLSRDLEGMRSWLERIVSGDFFQLGPGMVGGMSGGRFVIGVRKSRKVAGALEASGRVIFEELIVTTEPYPSGQDITDSIEAAIDGESPKIGDVVALTRDTGSVVVLKYELREAPEGQGNVGLFARVVTEGTGAGEKTFLAIGEQTGVYA